MLFRSVSQSRYGGWEGDDHMYLVVQRGNEAYAVDVPPGLYEIGGGYVWKKKPGATIHPDDIMISEIELPQEAMEVEFRDTDTPGEPEPNKFQPGSWLGTHNVDPAAPISNNTFSGNRTSGVSLSLPIKKLAQADMIDVIQESLDSTCIIRSTIGQRSWTGSGFRINPDMVLTCAHVVTEQDGPGSVVHPQTVITVSFNRSPQMEARVLAIDTKRDVAVLRIRNLGHNEQVGKALPLGSSTNITEGEPICTVGSPESIESIVTVGYIASDIREISDIPDSDAFFVNLEIHPGSSGGPVLNQAGEVIGVARGSIGMAENNDWLNYCIAIDSVKELLSAKNIAFVELAPDSQE